MTQFEKIATLFVRVFGLAILLLGSMGLVHSVAAKLYELAMSQSVMSQPIVSLIYVIAGVYLLKKSATLGKWIAKDMD